MKLPLYQIDAFTEHAFGGNPAAVCLAQSWPEDSLMQQIASENNLPATAFIVKQHNRYEIRWFTPDNEITLCGHATLASAYVLFNHLEQEARLLSFFSPKSGPLTVERGKEGLFVLDFPADPPVEIPPSGQLNEAMGKAPVRTFKGKTDYLLIYERQKDIEALEPDFSLLDKVEGRGVIASARGEEVDFVSRFFAIRSRIKEDPVTGSAHTTLIPYWSGILNKQRLNARQLSKRGGSLRCEALGQRVKIGGKAVLFFTGEISIRQNQNHKNIA